VNHPCWLLVEEGAPRSQRLDPKRAADAIIALELNADIAVMHPFDAPCAAIQKWGLLRQ
jgi:hypothetical protein